MKIKCDFCGSMIDETLKSCPNCGATLSGVNRLSSKEPKTIEQLKEWYTAHTLPPEDVTRFFIGKDIKEPKAFGIYKNVGGDFVVYKNKSDGQRAVRYEGTDEAYAVNELYQRLKAEIADQKSRNAVTKQKSNKTSKKKESDLSFWLIAGVIIFVGILIAIFDKSPDNGYYRFDNHDYYYQGSSWYLYDDLIDDWIFADSSPEINSDNESEYKTSNHIGKRFEDSEWYDVDDDDDWDSDSSWDSSDSWDSGSTDWDSDW
ncbi:MAG: hypothetical protein IJG16_07040 [Clostridia bacterium]|nr:hypothetical protein [Clostridia bacterium]